MGKIYTKRGDKGKTSLLTGKRVDKDHLRVEAYGTIDELNASLGISRTFTSEKIGNIIDSIQKKLFHLAAELANPREDYKSNSVGQRIEKIKEKDTVLLEKTIDELSDQLLPLSSFIIPGGSKASSFLHQSRTICRRAERRTLSLTKSDEINSEIIRYLNRLSDLLFVMARYANFKEKKREILLK
jgi:cob(I)alamin adenosyltransferase